MSSAKLVVLSGIAGLALSACGSISKPPAGHGKIDDPRTHQPNHVACLKQEHLQVVKVGMDGLQIGTPPAGPRVVFYPTPGFAQGLQMQGYRPMQGAEVIGSALLYPDQAPDAELKKVENCLAKGVSG